MIPLQDCPFIPNPSLFFSQFPSPHTPNSFQNQFPTRKIPSLFVNPKLFLSNSLKIHVSAEKRAPPVKIPAPVLQIARKMAPFVGTPTTNHPDFVHIHFSSRKTAPSFGLLAAGVQFTQKLTSFLKLSADYPPHSVTPQVSAEKLAPFFRIPAFSHNVPLFLAVSFPFHASAAGTELVPQRINIEEILISIDDFFNRNPFFVAGVTFIWLVVIPLTEEYLKKCKSVSAIDAFRKLRDVPNAQLLDIRKRRSVKFMSSPNLKILNKNVVQVEFTEGSEGEFVKKVLKNFGEPGNTIICILDNFDGDSLKVAELLYKNGFKEAYAIKGGLRGKDGWQAIQETYLPPSVHVYAIKQKRMNDEMNEHGSDNGQGLASTNSHQDKNINTENGYVKPTESASEASLTTERSLSPYPNYPDLKPPSSPTPSKPQG